MIDGKFGQVTPEKHGEHHPADEPVFVLCANDLSAAAALGKYLDESTRRGSGEANLQSVRDALARFYAWSSEHPELMHVAGA